ncbi:uncharacterized protein LOC130629572 isoform X2 [Hydractinia symbiolongicarpus]|uniref:uncharacterized protein LOC130629572 isoform X2 n=1 Tax=Hydractinia symbiolongicarpus TaxID=13093 RepID=UPI00254D6F76|nr:uncharacterized protein LOC130629572 isoform X2 [Hydractinia symbiolongicarpus]
MEDTESRQESSSESNKLSNETSSSHFTAKKKKIQKLTFGKRLKKCEECNAKNEIATKKCIECGNIIKKKRKGIEHYIPAGKSNPTLQKDIIHGRLLGLNEQHGYHSVLFMIKKGTKNITCDSYATPGFAEEFLGPRENRTPNGSIIIRTIKDCFQETHDISATRHVNKDSEVDQISVPENLEEQNRNMDEDGANVLLEELPNQNNETNATPDVVEESVYGGNFVDGVSVLPKSEITVGHILSVYAQPDDNETFWLLKVVSSTGRKIEGMWLNKLSECRYGIGDPCKVVWNNIVRISKDGKTYFVLHALSEAGVFHISGEAEQLLISNCN